MAMDEDQALIAQWQAEEQQPFAGWNFSYLTGRYHEEIPPWSYEASVRDLAREADSLLDLGTGGGEKLLELKDALPAHTVATEGYAPNVPIARANLEPHGIKVVAYNIDEEARMPFDDDSFPCIIDRHEAFDAVEIARILRPGGVFLTQQVDGRDLGEFLGWFGLQSTYLHVNLANCAKGLADAGLTIERAGDWSGKATFSDMGALVYFLHAAVWSAPPNFSVERYAKQLLNIHKNNRPLSFTIRRFIIQARKPARS